MIIKGMLKQYKRWNPVHPTRGGFWGMGIGLGCGVGWGPGFGPEVIGYVGAGCGIGFSVGITLVGVGIGLPTNFILEAPSNALVMAGRTMLGVVQSSGLLLMKNFGGDNLKTSNERVFGLKITVPLKQKIDFEKLRDVVSSNSKPVFESLNTIGKQLSDNSHKDTKN